MKRLSELECDHELNNKADLSVVVGMVILSIAVTIWFFVAIYEKSPMPSDYEQMEKQALAIQENPDLIYNTDCIIDNDNGIISVCFVNEKANCVVEARYNQDFEILSIITKDSGVDLGFAISSSLLLGFAFFIICVYFAYCWSDSLHRFFLFFWSFFKNSKA